MLTRAISHLLFFVYFARYKLRTYKSRLANGSNSCRSRGSFLKFARRQLRRKFGMTEGERIERVTFRERCLAICPFLNKLFPRKQNVCLLCGAVERSDQEPHIKCATPGCVGLFCIQCFADLQNLCTICRLPIEYGDLSDISEEK